MCYVIYECVKFVNMMFVNISVFVVFCLVCVVCWLLMNVCDVMCVMIFCVCGEFSVVMMKCGVVR